MSNLTTETNATSCSLPLAINSTSSDTLAVQVLPDLIAHDLDILSNTGANSEANILSTQAKALNQDNLNLENANLPFNSPPSSLRKSTDQPQVSKELSMIAEPEPQNVAEVAIMNVASSTGLNLNVVLPYANIESDSIITSVQPSTVAIHKTSILTLNS